MIDWDALVGGPCMAVFGEAEQPMYAPAAGGVPFAIDGVFDDAFKAVMMGDDGDPAIATIDPVLGVRLAQFAAAPVKGDKLTIPRVAKTYMVADVHPDGKGLAKLLLTRCDP